MRIESRHYTACASLQLAGIDLNYVKVTFHYAIQVAETWIV